MSELVFLPEDALGAVHPERKQGLAAKAALTDRSRLPNGETASVTPCFTPGTVIATATGEKHVEDLVVGDKIVTRDNGLQEIRWLGAKRLSGEALQANRHLQPVLIRAGALGGNLPLRDIVVSPNHRVLVASDQTALYFEDREVFCAAKHLINNRGIEEHMVPEVTYIHFMFDRHEVVLSNGAWTESFQPGDFSLRGIGNSQRMEILELFPELTSADGIGAYLAARKTLSAEEAEYIRH